MADPLDPNQLSPSMAGLVLALALDAGPGAFDLTACAAWVSGSEAAACRAALAALAALPSDQRARSLASLLGRVAAPLPPGIERVHPGWLRAVLQAEATEIVRAVSAGLPPEIKAVAHEIIAARDDDDGSSPAGMDPMAPVTPDDLTELRRALFASFAAMPDLSTAERPDAPAWQRLTALPSASLVEELARRGADVLGISLAGAPPAVLARAAAGAGPRVAAQVLAAARRTPGAPERDRARTLVSAAATLSRAPASLEPATAIGLLALADQLASESSESIRGLAQRLPPALGQRLLSAHADVNPNGRQGVGATNSGQAGSLVQS
jgi:hypothetical protein